MSDLLDTDLFVVERNGTNFKLPNNQMSTLQDSDLFVVERGGTNYKVKAEDVNGATGYFDPPVVVLTPLNGAGLNAGQSYEPFSSVITGESGGVLTFADNTELANIIGPVRMVDANGDVKVPVTSAVTNEVITNGSWNAQAAVRNDPWQSVAYGKQRYVAVAQGGALYFMYSYDGISWNQTPTVQVSSYSSVTFGGNLFIAVAESSAGSGPAGALLEYSSDGINWYSITVDQCNWFGVTYGNGTFVAVAYSGDTNNRAMWSSNGINWNAVPVPNKYNQWMGVTYGNGKFVAVAQTGSANQNVMYSTDNGATWSSNNISGVPANQWRSVAYGNGKFVSVAESGTNRAMYSTDGLNWTSVVVPINSWKSVTFGDGKFVAVASYGTNRVMYSYDGMSWTAIPSAEDSNSWKGVTYGNGKFVAVSEDGTNRVMWSTTGSGDFTTLTLTDSQDLQFLKAGDVVTAPSGTAQVLAFSTTLYPSNNATQTVETGIDNTSKSLIWAKKYDGTFNHAWYDTERGVSNRLSSNNEYSQSNHSDGINSFTTNGFVTGNDSGTNYNGNYVAWNFRALSGFMDIVKYNGTGTNNPQIPHQLGAVPKFMIIKRTNGTDHWYVYVDQLGQGSYLMLDEADSRVNSSTPWGGYSPTSTHFTVSTSSWGGTNGSTGMEYIAYLFSSDGVNTKTGYYPGNGSAGRSINVGFSVGFLIIKVIDQNTDWVVIDLKRGNGSGGANNKALWPNQPTPQENLKIELNSTGFRIWEGDNVKCNGNGQQYIWFAVRDGATGTAPVIPTGTLLSDANVSAKTIQIDSTEFSTGEILTGPTLNVVSNNVTSQSGNTLTVDTPTGTGSWRAGLYAEGATITRAGPSPTSIVFTSANAGSTPVTGLDATLDRRVWTLESSNSASGPWTVVGEYPDTAATASQDGATPWGNPTLAANTFYQVKVKYESINADAVESVYNTFRTGNA